MRVVVLALLVAVVFLLGCAVEATAPTGSGLRCGAGQEQFFTETDAAGNLIAALAWCDPQFDGSRAYAALMGK